MVRLPRVLDANLAEARRVRPTAYNINEDMRAPSTATMTVAQADAPDMHQWMELYTAEGSVGLFRVTDISDDPASGAKITLRHAIDTLSDEVWPEQTDYEGTVAGFIQALLSKQATARWQLGRCDDAAAYKKSGINYDHLSDLMWGMAGEKSRFYFTYDFATTPWTLNYVEIASEPSAGFRLSRNMAGVKIRRMDGDMCTRLYLSINTAVTEDGVTTNQVEYRTINNAEAQARYGIIIKTADIDTADVADVDAWIAEYMAQRAQPRTQATVEGYALRQITGDAWDAPRIGHMARVDMPDYGETLLEYVASMKWPSPLDEPERVTVELQSHMNNAAETIAQIAKAARSAGRSARSAARGAASGEQLKQWSIIVSDHTEALDGTGLTELWESGIILDAKTGVKIYSLNQGFQSQYAEIQVNSAAITQEVRRATAEEALLSGRITVEAGRISQIVSAVGENGEVTAASIVLAINEDGSSGVAIDGDHINITANQDFSAVAGRVTTIEGDVSEIEGSTLWLDRENLAAISGHLVYDANGNLTVTNGAGLWVKRNGVSYGVWDNGNLTGGVIVEKINGETTTTISGDHVNITANSSFSALVGTVDGHGTRITATEQGLTSEVSRATSAEGTLSTRVTQNADAITAEVERATNAESGLDSSISTVRQTANSVSAEVANARGNSATLVARLTVMQNEITSEVTNRQDADSEMSTKITQNANAITTKVSAGDIASTINQTAQSVRISASKIDLDGYVTVSDLSATNAAITNLTNGTTTATMIRANNISATAILGDSVTTPSLWVGSFNAEWGKIKMTGISAEANALMYSPLTVDFAHSHGVTVATNGTVTIGGAQSANGTFNIASTAFYQNGVEAAYNNGWAAAQAKVAWPQAGTETYAHFETPSQAVGETYARNYHLTVDDWSNGTTYARMRIGQVTGSTVARIQITAPAVSSYDDGWKDAVRALALPGNSTSSSTTITAPTLTVGNTQTRTYRLSQNGWSSGANKVYLNDVTDTAFTVAMTTVSMPTSASWTITQSGGGISIPSGTQITAVCTAGGKSYSTTKTF